MTPDERAIVVATYNHMRTEVLSTALAAGVSPQTLAIIQRTLHQLQDRLTADPQDLHESAVGAQGLPSETQTPSQDTL